MPPVRGAPCGALHILYRKTLNGTVLYVLGNPLFYTNHKYQFVAEAYEEYYYNNNEAHGFERVPWRGGEVIVRNGMETNGTVYTFPLDEEGRNNSIYLPVDYIDVETEGKAAMRTISVSLKTEGNVVESESINGFVVGSLTEWGEMESTDTNIQLLDIIRDPGGAGSSAYIEKGSTYSFGYTFHLDAAVGINLQPTWGSDVSMNVGIVTGAVTAGTYTGQTISAASKLSFDLPIVFKWDNGSDFSYSFTTNERISTSSESSIMHVGTDADVYVGATVSRLVGKVKSVFWGKN